jgi:hypothetical protein
MVQQGVVLTIQLHQHPLHVPEDIFATLNGVHLFSQIDFSDSYLQVELDDDSKKLCNFNTHRGVCEYQRLPFGVKSAPGIFQTIMENMLAALPFATAYLDDIGIMRQSSDDHRHHLHAVFDKINEYGFRARFGKCSLFHPSVNYIGLIVNKDGRRPKPHRVTAVGNKPAPNSITTFPPSLGWSITTSRSSLTCSLSASPLMTSSRRKTNGTGQLAAIKRLTALKVF